MALRKKRKVVRTAKKTRRVPRERADNGGTDIEFVVEKVIVSVGQFKPVSFELTPPEGLVINASAKGQPDKSASKIMQSLLQTVNAADVEQAGDDDVEEEDEELEEEDEEEEAPKKKTRRAKKDEDEGDEDLEDEDDDEEDEEEDEEDEDEPPAKKGKRPVKKKVVAKGKKTKVDIDSLTDEIEDEDED